MNKPFMSHMVCGYPNISESLKIYNALSCMSQYVEIQFPFSDPLADGPVISNANTSALKTGITTQNCFDFLKDISQTSPVNNIIMTYYQVVFHYGVEKFIQEAAILGVYGCIIPDIPIETPEGQKLLGYCQTYGVSFIPIISPSCSKKRLQKISKLPGSLIYAMSSNMTTGNTQDFGKDFSDFILKLRTYFPYKKIAVGFGIQTREDRKKVLERADIAVMGSILIHIYQEKGIGAVEAFLKDA